MLPYAYDKIVEASRYAESKLLASSAATVAFGSIAVGMDGNLLLRGVGLTLIALSVVIFMTGIHPVTNRFVQSSKKVPLNDREINVLFYKHVADCQRGDLIDRLKECSPDIKEERLVAEFADQMKSVARITDRKFRSFERALPWLFMGITAILAAQFLASADV